MGAFATSSPYGSGEVTGSGTANQVSVWASASSLGVGTISFTSSATGYAIGTLTALPSGILTLHSTTQGFYPPRMTTAQRNLIATPEAGLIVFNTSQDALSVYTAGGAWDNVVTTESYPTTFVVGDILYASTTSLMSRLADVEAGSYLRSGGVSTAPVWSTLILPNSATAGQIVYATSTNTYGGSSGYIIGQGTIGVSLTTTSTASIVEGLRVALSAGYTGAATSFAAQMYNAAAGTGANLELASSFTNPAGNSGLNVFAHATTTGYNIGGYYEALGGNINVGVIGKAITNKSSATNIGVIGVANQTTGTPIRIGGYFALDGSDTPTFTGLSAGLVVNVGATGEPLGIFLYGASNYLTLSISSAGAVTYQATGSSARHNFANKLSSTHPTGGIGYNTGAGGAVTQATNKSTGVTLNKVCGQITMNNAALAGGASVVFTLTNSAISTTDNLIVAHASGGTANSYTVDYNNVTAGTVDIVVTNKTGGSLSEAIVINYAILKGVIT